MNKLAPLIIGDLKIKMPVVQGGMGVGISLSSLAGAVARAGGVGIISTAQIGFREPDFMKNPLEANLRAIGKELKKARDIAPEGVIGFNIMVATKNYANYVKEAVRAGADLIISGAGLPVNLPEYVKDAKTKIAPIVSSVKSAMVICKLWDRKYGKAPDMVVIEGPLAGGHLGFAPEELESMGADSSCVSETYNRKIFEDEIKAIIKLIKEYADKYKKNIPVITAGGIYSHEDFVHQMELGADGVQVATRFVTTEECDAPDIYKQAYINAKEEDIVITKSPVGMPGRAIKNSFLKTLGENPFQLEHCYQCLEHCDRKTIPYCISKSLIHSAEGKTDTGLLFCGSKAYMAEKIETVNQVIQDLVFGT